MTTGAGTDGPVARVAVLLPTLAGGGAQRVMVMVANALSARAVNVDLVLGSARGEYGHLIQPEVEVIDLAAPKMGLALVGLARYLRRARPDALLSTLPHANLSAVLARAVTGVPDRLVLREANTPSRALGKGLKDRGMAAMLPWAYRRADAVIAVSEGVARDIHARVELPSGHVQVIHNPVDVPEVRRKAREPPPHPWLRAEEPPVVLGAGQLTAQKDFATLVRAFSEVRSEREARLIILGEGPQRRKLESLTSELDIADSVEMPGFTANPFAYMGRAAVFALSSAWEGFPNVLLEALATGCPVVSTDCPSGPQEILREGRDGTLVPVGDHEALADAISKTLDEPRDSERLYHRATDFALAGIAAEYMAVILGDVLPGGH